MAGHTCNPSSYLVDTAVLTQEASLGQPELHETLSRRKRKGVEVGRKGKEMWCMAFQGSKCVDRRISGIYLVHSALHGQGQPADFSSIVFSCSLFNKLCREKGGKLKAVTGKAGDWERTALVETEALSIGKASPLL